MVSRTRKRIACISVCPVYHTQLTVHVLPEKRTAHEQNPKRRWMRSSRSATLMSTEQSLSLHPETLRSVYNQT
jgi:hypothetical protein